MLPVSGSASVSNLEFLEIQLPLQLQPFDHIDTGASVDVAFSSTPLGTDKASKAVGKERARGPKLAAAAEARNLVQVRSQATRLFAERLGHRAPSRRSVETRPNRCLYAQLLHFPKHAIGLESNH
jgi:hypothetical protein